MASKFNFSGKAQAWGSLKRQALLMIADDAKETFDKAFDDEQLNGAPKWDEVERRKPGTLAYTLADGAEHTDKILTGKTRTLGNNNNIKSVTENRAILENPTHYAQVQNEGGLVGGGITKVPHNIPARPFMIQTAVMTSRQLTILKVITGKVWNVK